MKRKIDINCDMGEGMPYDAQIMPYISSANIACGFHAGDNDTMKRTVDDALKHQVAIGAHPSFNDKKNFGRTEMNIPAEQIFQLVSEQIFLLDTICNEMGARIHHVKPHGALYNMAAKNNDMSIAIVQAIQAYSPTCLLYGLSQSCLTTEAKNASLPFAHEVFADRTYTEAGTLTPRTQPNALVETDEQMIAQALQMIVTDTVQTTNGKTISIQADTLCIHGDGEHALHFAQKIYHTLNKRHIEIKTI